LEVSKDLVEEVKQDGYSQVASGKVEKRVEEGVKLLRRAKEAAKRGDMEKLEDLLDAELFKTLMPEEITLGDIIDYLSREVGETIADHVVTRVQQDHRRRNSRDNKENRHIRCFHNSGEVLGS